MTETKFTPGPWKVVRNSRNCTLNVVSAPDADGESFKIALVNYQDEANANLIAAAPDLYAATDLPGINGIEFSDTMADDSKMELHLTVGQFRALQAARRKARGE